MIKNQYYNKGYVVLRGVLTKSEVNSIRDTTNKELNEFRGQKGIDYVLKRQDLWELSLNSKILNALNDIFNSKIHLINDFDFQINNPKNTKKRPGWHIDAGSQLDRLDKILFSQEYKFAKIGVYMQDNSEDFGGGIDVEIAGHKSFQKFKSKKSALLYYGLDRAIFSKFRKKTRLDIDAGDVVIFDARLPHASSAPKQDLDNIPSAKRKISLYWSAFGNQNSVTAWRTDQLLSAFNTLGKQNQKFFANTLQYSYPTSYPKKYTKAVESIKEVVIVSPSCDVTSFFSAYCKNNNINNFEIPFDSKKY